MDSTIFKTKKFEFSIEDILNIAKKAGEEVLKIYNKDFEVEYKDDKSPLTKADKIEYPPGGIAPWPPPEK